LCEGLLELCEGLLELCEGLLELCEGLLELCEGLLELCEGLLELCEGLLELCFILEKVLYIGRKIIEGLNSTIPSITDTRVTSITELYQHNMKIHTFLSRHSVAQCWAPSVLLISSSSHPCSARHRRWRLVLV
jgi:hypothetical protein